MIFRVLVNRVIFEDGFYNNKAANRSDGKDYDNY